MKKYQIMAVLVSNRKANATDVQNVLTKYGCNIQIRLGLHEISNVCAEDGLIILQLGGNQEDIQALENALIVLPGVKTKFITLESD